MSYDLASQPCRSRREIEGKLICGKGLISSSLSGWEIRQKRILCWIQHFSDEEDMEKVKVSLESFEFNVLIALWVKKTFVCTQ